MPRKITKFLSSVDRLMQEWDWDKNVLDPKTLGAQSNQFAWWKCKYGHSWKAKINNRYNGRGCPICKYRLKTSFPEQAVFFYIKKVFPDAINGYTDIFNNGMELDIFIPSVMIGIEYDGKAWHSKKTIGKEKTKFEICQNNKIYLLRIAESLIETENTCDEKIVINGIPAGKCLDHAIIRCLKLITNIARLNNEKVSHSDFVNTDRDRNTIFKQYLVEFEKNSLGNKYPEVAKEWNTQKNGTLTPKMFLPHSSTIVWWICNKGHEWRASISTRVSGRGCPYCSGNYVLKGFNDLATIYPEIASQWSYDRNGTLKPSDVTFGSGKKVWWVCDNGHEWQAAINNRTSNKRGCPYCTNEKTLIGINDLQTINPALASEWHPSKNNGLLPQNFKPYSNIKVWWLCPKCGYEYQAVISDRSNGCGCRNCANRVLHSGINDLETLYPEIAKQWNYEKNGDLKPFQVFPKSNKKVWWICCNGHTWEASPNSRTSGRNCPYCAGNKVWVGYNDLATTHKELAKEWDYEKNGDFTPKNVSAGSGRKFWWICSKCGCSFQSYISNRIKGYGCKCSSKHTERIKYIK